MGKPEEIAHSAACILENYYYSGRILGLEGGCGFSDGLKMNVLAMRCIRAASPTTWFLQNDASYQVTPNPAV